ncbi:dihydrodipicolinate synthase family protein [candidate division KSB1 bacterium]|nr:dihydrodipicolinate synthase family protein [candidate division KSB1 bacterium]
MSKELYPLFGIITVLNTPFTADNRPDYSAFRRHIEYAIRSGVAGFLVPAMASEVHKLSVKERLGLVETALTTSAGRVPVIGGAGETDEQRRLEMVRQLLNLGCNNVLLQIPFSSNDEYRSAVLQAADLGPDMIMIQDWDFGGGGLPLDLICRLFDEVDSFRCLKIETVPAGPKYSQVIAATDNRLHVSGGWAVSTMIEGLERGVHAFMPTALHELYCLIYLLFQHGKKQEATEWFHRILPVLAFSNQHLDISIHFFKRLLCAQGIYNTARVREPILPFDAVHKKQADELVSLAIELLAKADERHSEILF